MGLFRRRRGNDLATETRSARRKRWDRLRLQLGVLRASVAGIPFRDRASGSGSPHRLGRGSHEPVRPRPGMEYRLQPAETFQVQGPRNFPTRPVTPDLHRLKPGLRTPEIAERTRSLVHFPVPSVPRSSTREHSPGSSAPSTRHGVPASAGGNLPGPRSPELPHAPCSTGSPPAEAGTPYP